MGAGAISNRFSSHQVIAKTAQPELVLAALKARLPRTTISSIGCAGLGGLCEVVAGTTLFYVDRTARFLVIGRVYDMETRSDLTAAKLLAMNPDMLAAGGARRQAASADQASESARPVRTMRVNLSELPEGGAIRWGPGTGPKLIVLSDFSCGYCRRLSTELKAIGARVEERPISIFGPASRAAAERVLCAPDPEKALHAAYEQNEIAAPRKCDTSGLDANEAFAKRHGFGGTPVIIRPDGAVLEGYRPASVLKAFALGGAA
ncbi:DsbC family protein [Sphingomonas sp. ID1715]|nr:DsbC family protein [Sphingomonas sp. ID1715]NNM77678.1 DsbC family protein [Sphingomonas sp. ID1715]